MGIEQFDELDEVSQRACQTIDFAGPNVGKEMLQAGRPVDPPEKPPSS